MAPLTARDVVGRIGHSLDIQDATADSAGGLIAGDPARIVTGIATTSSATLDVLREAVTTRANLIITLEPAFYGRADLSDARLSGGPDPVLAAKQEFIRRKDLIVWRMGDSWRARRPDPLAAGLAEALGLSPLERAGTFGIRPTNLGRLVSHAHTALGARGGIRAVGDPALRIERVGLLPGSTPLRAILDLLPLVDVVLGGEMREWEGVEYARDQVSSGAEKGLVLVGRVLSEEPGMHVCARWLRTLVPEVRTHWLRAGDPYWRPA